jgi:hypothetical protein
MRRLASIDMETAFEVSRAEIVMKVMTERNLSTLSLEDQLVG